MDDTCWYLFKVVSIFNASAVWTMIHDDPKVDWAWHLAMNINVMNIEKNKKKKYLNGNTG